MPQIATAETRATETYRSIASQITFGVEIETHVDRRVEVGSYSDGLISSNENLPTFNRKGWIRKSDGSIVPPTSTRRGCEFVSPVLVGETGLRNLVDAIKTIKAPLGELVTGSDGVTRVGMGAKINASCGVHIHIGVPDTLTITQLRNLVALMAGFEDGLYAATGTKSREEGRYCRKIKEAYRPAMRSWQDTPEDFVTAATRGDRYFGLNLRNVLRGDSKRTVEFRLWSASLNPVKIVAWVQVCLGLVELALALPRPALYDPQPAGERFGKNAGRGTRELNRLLARLGWVKNRTTWFGTIGIVSEGEGLFTRRVMVKELRRLAAQYDDPMTGATPETDNAQ